MFVSWRGWCVFLFIFATWIFCNCQEMITHNSRLKKGQYSYFLLHLTDRNVGGNLKLHRPKLTLARYSIVTNLCFYFSKYPIQIIVVTFLLTPFVYFVHVNKRKKNCVYFQNPNKYWSFMIWWMLATNANSYSYVWHQLMGMSSKHWLSSLSLCSVDHRIR